MSIIVWIVVLTCLAVILAGSVYCFTVALKAWERQVTLDTDLSKYDVEIESWEDFWEAQDERYIASLTGAEYLDATGVHDDDRGTEHERLMAEVRAGIVPDIFKPCGWCRRCALHDDPGGCLTVEEYERDFPEVAALSIAMARERSGV